MKLKRILLTLFLAIGLTGLSFAGPYDDWPDDAVCMWLEMKPTHAGYLAEAKKRSLTCEGGKAVAAPAKTTTSTSSKTSSKKTTSTKSSGIKFYAIEFTEKLRKKLFDSIKDFFVEVDTSTKFDGQYTFRLYRYHETEGTKGLGSGLIKIKNGEMIVEKDKRTLKTGPKDLYDTFEGQVDENGQVYGSIELDILSGKERSEVYTLNGPIKKIWGESPDECCMKVYFQPKLITESSTAKTLSTSSSDSTTASSSFDGRYRFSIYRHNENDGAMVLGGGYIRINNSEMSIETDNSYLTTASQDLYDTFEGQVDEKGNVSASVELAILFGKDRSEIYNIDGQIDKKIWGESPAEDYFKVYLLLTKQ